MATSTTTAKLIREDRRDIIRALSPEQLSRAPFREYIGSEDFRTWAESKSASCFRRFQVRDLHTYEPPTISDTVLEEIATTFEVTVAYPSDGRYRGDVVTGLDDAIRSDQTKINDSLGVLSQGDYPAGCSLFQLVDYRSEEADSVVFLVATYDVIFKRSLVEVVAAIIEERITEGGLTRLSEGGLTRVTE